MDLHRRRQLIEIVRQQFRLEWHGIHGVPHWGRVRWNGLAMARVNGAREDVVELFAFLHDSQRFHDGTDREDGARAADYALELNREVLRLDLGRVGKAVGGEAVHGGGAGSGAARPGLSAELERLISRSGRQGGAKCRQWG